MLLKNLIKNSPKSLEKLKIKGLALNSKDVKKGFIFFAVKGNQSNGESYINDAIKNGSIIIICSKSCKFKSTKVNVIKTNKVRKYLSEITSKFYNSGEIKMAKLFFYYSAMNAGKSTTLVQSSYNYNERGMETLVFTASIDNRFEERSVSTRIGIKAQAICFDKNFDFYDFVIYKINLNPNQMFEILQTLFENQFTLLPKFFRNPIPSSFFKLDGIFISLQIT